MRKTNLSNDKPARGTRPRSTAALLSAATPAQLIETKRTPPVDSEAALDGPVEPTVEVVSPEVEALPDPVAPPDAPKPRAVKPRRASTSAEPPRFEYQIPEREAILAALRSAAVPLMPEELAARLEVVADQMPGFDRRLAAMERDGQLMPNRKGVLLLANKLDFVAGRVVGHRDGYGFLIRDDRASPDIWLAPK